MKINIKLIRKNKGILIEEKYHKKVEKIAKMQEDKKDFLPLFSGELPAFLSEKQIKNKLFKITQNYFKIKDKINENAEIV